MFFAWNVSQMLKELEAKRNVVIHLVKSIAGACALTIKHSVFSVITRLIVEMLFMLFSV